MASRCSYCKYISLDQLKLPGLKEQDDMHTPAVRQESMSLRFVNPA
jgi:hypothetical protein